MSQGAKSWYYAKGGQQQGPLSLAQMRQLTTNGQVGPEDLVWADGMTDWVPASTIQSLAPDGTGVPAPMGYATPLQYRSGQTDVVYAGFWLRFVAFIIDQIILRLVGFVSGFIIGAIGGALGNTGNTNGLSALNVIAMLIGIAIAWLYYALQESSSSQATLGKRLLGLKVTNMHGEPITFARASGRFFAKIVSGLILLVGYIMAGFTERKQALHDMMANTLVVKK